MSKIASKGTALQLDIATVFTTIVQVENIDGPPGDVGTMDVTCLESGVGREHEPDGHAEGGEVSGSLFFDPVAVTHQALTDLILAPAVSQWKIIWSDAAGTEWPFDGILKKFQPKAAVGEPLKADWSVKLDGLPAYPT